MLCEVCPAADRIRSPSECALAFTALGYGRPGGGVTCADLELLYTYTDRDPNHP